MYKKHFILLNIFTADFITNPLKSLIDIQRPTLKILFIIKKLLMN